MPHRGWHPAACVAGLLVAGAALTVPGAVSAAAAAESAASAAGPSSPAAPTATGLLLTRADLGRGWTFSAAAPRRVSPIACAKLHLKLHGGAAHPTAAASPTYAQSTSGPFVAQTAYRYESAAQARQVWRGVDRRAFEACLAEAVTAGGAHGVRFTVDREQRRAAPRLPGVMAGAFRITATASQASGESVSAYLDALLVRSGDALTEVSYSTVLAPPAAGLELRVARRVAKLLRAKTS